MRNKSTAVGFFEPPTRPPGDTACYLRTRGGATICVDGEAGGGAAGLLVWVCGGCKAHAGYGWPLTFQTPRRFKTEQAAWRQAKRDASTHARQCAAGSR